jgi:hypothetical protein
MTQRVVVPLDHCSINETTHGIMSYIRAGNKQILLY